MLRTLVLMAVAGGIAGTAAAQALPVGFYRSGVPVGPLEEIVPRGISADGRRVIGTASRSRTVDWFPGAEPMLVAPASNIRPSEYFHNAISASAVHGRGFEPARNGYSAVRWQFGQAPELLGHLPGYAETAAYASSTSGDVVFGAAETPWFSGTVGEPVRWTQQTGFVGLGPVPGGGQTGRALDCTADGSEAVGWGSNGDTDVAFRWTLESGYRVYPNFTAFSVVSPTGDWVVGDSNTMGLARMGRSGAVEPLDPSGTWSDMIPAAMSDDGSIIIGEGEIPTSTGDELFIWTESEGIARFADYVALRGIQFPSDLNIARSQGSIKGVSADGLTFAGSGINALGQNEGWVVVLPTPGILLIAALASPLAVRRRR